MIRRVTTILGILLLLATACHAANRTSTLPQLREEIDWSDFLSRHEMVWERLPGNWREAPWTGNGLLGAMIWKEGDSLRLQVFRGDVQSHRSMTQGHSGFTRSRLQIGSFYLWPTGKPIGCDLRMDYLKAELTGIVRTDKGEIRLRHFTHAHEMAIVVELEASGGEQGCRVTWKADSPMPTRAGYPKSAEDLPAVQKVYGSRYPTEIYAPDPPARLETADGVEVCVQDLLGGARHVTAWKLREIAPGRQRLAASIGNRWPDWQNDPVADAVAIVQRVCRLEDSDYRAWKELHYQWWRNYYPASFVSVPDTPVETVYWTQMLKLGSATRADRVIMDTAGIWQTPSRWPFLTWDFNPQYCYYPVITSNRLELGMSLVDTIDRYRENLVRNVRPVEWQVDSAYLPVNTGMDLYQPKDVDCRSFQNTGGHLVWAMHACWLVYRGAMDDALLREKIYPVLKRAVQYQIHRLQKRDGKYHAPLSHSPEYGDAPDANYELALLRWGCHALLAANRRLGMNDSGRTTWQDVLDNLVDYPVDAKTGFMVGTGEPFRKNHRHWCHLMMIHPLNLVTGKDPAEADLVRKSIENFMACNRGGPDIAPFQHTGTSAMWSLLGRGDEALADLHKFVASPVNCPNSMNHYGGVNPCLETPLYAAQCLHEMLLQSYDEFGAAGRLTNTIRVFPAVPGAWKDVVFHNLRAQGGFLVSAVRREGRTSWVRVQSLAGEPCRVKARFDGTIRLLAEGETQLRQVAPDVYELPLARGEQAVLYSGDKPPELVIRPVTPAGPRNHYGLHKD